MKNKEKPCRDEMLYPFTLDETSGYKDDDIDSMNEPDEDKNSHEEFIDDDKPEF